MPSHYGNKSMPKKTPVAMATKKGTKSADDPSGSAEKSIKGFRKMTDREKKLLAKHFESNPHDKSQKARMRSAVMKRPEVKSMKGLEKIHREVFSD